MAQSGVGATSASFTFQLLRVFNIYIHADNKRIIARPAVHLCSARSFASTTEQSQIKFACTIPYGPSTAYFMPAIPSPLLLQITLFLSLQAHGFDYSLPFCFCWLTNFYKWKDVRQLLYVKMSCFWCDYTQKHRKLILQRIFYRSQK